MSRVLLTLIVLDYKSNVTLKKNHIQLPIVTRKKKGPERNLKQFFILKNKNKASLL